MMMPRHITGAPPVGNSQIVSKEYMSYAFDVSLHVVRHYYVGSFLLSVVFFMNTSDYYYRVGDILNRLFVVDESGS